MGTLDDATILHYETAAFDSRDGKVTSTTPPRPIVAVAVRFYARDPLHKSTCAPPAFV